MGALRFDLRYAFRRLRKSPGATALSLTLLALGTGANLAVFTLVNTLYFKPLHVPDPARLVHLYARRPGSIYNIGFSFREYEPLAAGTSNLTPLAAVRSVVQLHLVSRRGVREVGGAFVTDNYFPTLAIRPARGTTAGAVISDRLWRSYFASDAAVLGAPITINGIAVTVTGVTGSTFNGDEPGLNTEVWLPMALLRPAGLGCTDGRDCTTIDSILGRLRDGRTLGAALAETSASIQWSSDRGRTTQRQLLMTPAFGAGPDLRAELGAQMQLLAAVTSTLVLIVCVNLAGLTLARGVSQAKEVAVRLSLGATRARVARQLMTESLVTGLAGAALGLLVSVWLGGLLSSFYVVGSEGFEHFFDFDLDARVFGYSLLVSVATAVLFGLVPALQISRQNVVAHLKEYRASDSAPRARTLRNTLVAVQVALSLVLVVSSGLLLRSGRTVLRGANFDPDHLAVLRLRPELAQYTPEKAAAFIRRAAAALKSAPGTESVAMMIGGEGLMWRWGSGVESDVSIPGGSSEFAAARVPTQDVDAGFFETLRIPLRAGRGFTETDAASSGVAVIGDRLATRLWPDGDPLGRTFVVRRRTYRVVGIVASLEPVNELGTAGPHVYLPFDPGDPGAAGDVRFAVRVSGSPAAALPILRNAVRAVDPNVPLGEDMPMSTQMALMYAPVLLARSVMSACGLLAAFLSAVGLYSVLALAVRSRTREIGVRMALGASPRDVARAFIDQAVVIGAIGIGAGLAIAWAVTRLLRAWLYGVTVHDVATYAGSAVVLLAIAIVAGYLPARHAARLDPIAALRHE